MKSKIVDEFIMNFAAKSTKRNYRWAVVNFFKYINKNPDKYFTKNDPDYYKKDILEYLQSDKMKNYAPKTFHNILDALLSFFEEYKIVFSKKQKKRFHRFKKGKRAITKDKIPTKQELRLILSNASLKSKALYLTMLSSGMRRGEITQIAVSDVDFDSRPTEIYISEDISKNDEERIAFVSDEATGYLLEWLKQREKYLQTTSKRINKQKGPIHNKDVNDNRLFPFDSCQVQSTLVRLLKTVDLDMRDKRTNRHIYHSHCLRKYFATRLKVEMPEVIVETLLGHSGYLNGVYDKFTEEELSEHYIKHMSVLQIFETGAPVERLEKLEQNGKHKDSEIDQLKDITKKQDEMIELLMKRLEKTERHWKRQIPEKKKRK